MDGLSNLTQEELPQEREGERFSKKDCLSLKQIASEAVIKAESKVIRDTLELTHWNRKKAAMMLNISYKTLLNKIDKINRCIDNGELKI
jgi:DNA-binding NtrC family response regulator